MVFAGAEELCECTASARDERDRQVGDTDARQWRTHLHAYAKEKAGEF
jgi:hypothetical protein